jgi:acetyl-CoA acetyltransferase
MTKSLSSTEITFLDDLSKDRDPGIKRRAREIRDRLSMKPMTEILAFVPDGTITAKARACGVSRQTFYTWMNGARPKKAQAARLAKITGFTIAEIRGFASPAPTSSPTARVPSR